MGHQDLQHDLQPAGLDGIAQLHADGGQSHGEPPHAELKVHLPADSEAVRRGTRRPHAWRVHLQRRVRAPRLLGSCLLGHQARPEVQVQQFINVQET